MLVILPNMAYANEEVVITSDELMVFQAKKQATFSGRVKAVQKDIEITCDSMVVYYQDTSTDNTSGHINGGKIERITFNNNVIFKTANEHAIAQRGDYDLRTEILNLYDNVKLVQKQNTIEGDMLVYNRQTGKSVLKRYDNNNKGRVKAILIPERQG